MQVTDKEFESDLVQFLEGTGQERLAKNVRGKHVGWCAHSRPTLQAQPADVKNPCWAQRAHLNRWMLDEWPSGHLSCHVADFIVFLTLTCPSYRKANQTACLTPNLPNP